VKDRLSPTSTFLPSLADTYLLRAALLRGPIAIDAWRSWQRAVDFDAIGLGGRRLLPLLFDNLIQQGVQDPILAKYEGVKKLYWYHSQLLSHQLKAILEAFAAANVPAMPVKGCALNLLGYFQPGQRPMTDLDIVVPQHRAFDAAGALESLGWHFESTRNKPLALNDVSFSAHGKFTKGKVLVVELHWESPTQFLRGPAPNDVWQRSLPAIVQRLPCRVLNPADQLLHILAHGADSNTIAPIRWAADAHAIICSEAIDWSDFVSQSKRQHLVVSVRELLRFLLENLNTPIPAEAIIHLDDIRPRLIERVVADCAHLPEQQVGFLGAFRRHTFYLNRFSGGRPRLRFVFGYIKYVALSQRHGSQACGLLQAILRRIGISLRPPRRAQ
jgi:hypothetical protein